jgi:hypothetical protein
MPIWRASEVHSTIFNEEHTMAKGDQKSNKMAKKPKKDTSLPPETTGTSSRPVAPMTAVLPKGKLKNKPGA